jgi:hypothetical protein
VIHHIIWNANVLGHPAGIIDIVERATAAGHLLRHALAAGQPPLVPELHGQADQVVPFGAQHGRDGGRIHATRHGYGDHL